MFAEVKAALGMPYVSLLYKAYAAYPKFLDLHWQAFKPVVETQEFFDLAGRLRAEAYTRMHNYFRLPDLCAQLTEESFSPGAQHELTRLIETLHASNPPVLLLAAAALQAFDKPIGRERKIHPAQAPSRCRAARGTDRDGSSAHSTARRTTRYGAAPEASRRIVGPRRTAAPLRARYP